LCANAKGEVPPLVPNPSDAVRGPIPPANLARVVAEWPHLPEPIKVAILALVQAAGGSNV
jgi:hypothetical protein